MSGLAFMGDGEWRGRPTPSGVSHAALLEGALLWASSSDVVSEPPTRPFGWYLARDAGKEHPEGEGGGRFFEVSFCVQVLYQELFFRERVLNQPLGGPAIFCRVRL